MEKSVEWEHRAWPMAGDVLVVVEEFVARIFDVCIDIAAVTVVDMTGEGVEESGKISSKVPAPLSI